MPIYNYRCEECKGIKEMIQEMGADPPSCCGLKMSWTPAPIAMVRIKGKGYPSRRKWMDNWTPQSEKFQTGSLHGEKY